LTLHERLQNSERGVAAVEMGFMVAPIAVIVIVVVSLPRTHLSTLFNPSPTASESTGWRLASPPDPLQLSSAEPTPYSPDGGSNCDTNALRLVGIASSATRVLPSATGR